MDSQSEIGFVLRGRKVGKEKGEGEKGNTSLITTRGRRGFLRFLRIVKPSEVKAVCLTRLIDFTVSV